MEVGKEGKTEDNRSSVNNKKQFKNGEERLSAGKKIIIKKRERDLVCLLSMCGPASGLGLH